MAFVIEVQIVERRWHFATVAVAAVVDVAAVAESFAALQLRMMMFDVVFAVVAVAVVAAAIVTAEWQLVHYFVTALAYPKDCSNHHFESSTSFANYGVVPSVET